MVFGLQTHEGEFHKCAFTPVLLRADLEQAGFKVLHVEFRRTHNQETIQATCVKEDKPPEPKPPEPKPPEPKPAAGGGQPGAA